MYDDDSLWPLKCPDCREEFAKKIGWLKAHTEVKCPGVLNELGPILCPMTITYTQDDLARWIGEAKAGRLDPWAIWVRRQRPA